ncbi:hypothetical protein ACIOZL_05660 [Streptomyces sp. NPDC087769]|uniref:hypothetical protein n=1 Tax=Streptomyces sp. NPDC087769 TaxID=3365802 RepID=UPI00381FDBF4
MGLAPLFVVPVAPIHHRPIPIPIIRQIRLPPGRVRCPCLPLRRSAPRPWPQPNGSSLTAGRAISARISCPAVEGFRLLGLSSFVEACRRLEGPCERDEFAVFGIGGFFLDCDGCGTIGGAEQIIRYDISENDCRMSSVSAGRSALHMYSNVLCCTDKKLDITLPDESPVENNIWVGTAESRLPTGRVQWLWNAFQGVPRPTPTPTASSATRAS